MEEMNEQEKKDIREVTEDLDGLVGRNRTQQSEKPKPQEIIQTTHTKDKDDSL